MSDLYKQYEGAPGGTKSGVMNIAMGQYRVHHATRGVVPNIGSGEIHLSTYEQVQALTDTGKVWREACKYGNPEGFMNFLLVCMANSIVGGYADRPYLGPRAQPAAAAGGSCGNVPVEQKSSAEYQLDGWARGRKWGRNRDLRDLYKWSGMASLASNDLLDFVATIFLSSANCIKTDFFSL